MYGWLIVWSQAMGRAQSSCACRRSSGGRNRTRGTRPRAASTRGSPTPLSRTCRASASEGEGSGGRGMAVSPGHLEVLDLELDFAAAVPLVDARQEGDRADGAGRERLAALGQ